MTILRLSARLLIVNGSMCVETTFEEASTNETKNNQDWNLGRSFHNVAMQRSSFPAITQKTNCWSYGQLLGLAHAVKNTLSASENFQVGDRVVLMADNSIEYLMGFYGILLAGGIVVPLPPKTESGMLAHVVGSVDARIIITTEQLIHNREDLKCLSTLPSQENRSHSEIHVTEQEDCGTAAIFFTAGSSGSPKGIVLSHRNLISNAQSIQQYLQIDEQDRPLCVLPFFHAFGNSVLQSHLLAGAHLVVDGSSIFPQTLLQAITHHQCTSLSAVPDLFRMLIEHGSADSMELPSLQYMAVAGGALPIELSRVMQRRIAPANFFVMYGQTEATARLAYVPAEKLSCVPDNCLGQAIPGVELKVVDQQGTECEQGTVGELIARGPNIMQGIWQDQNATEERIKQGWLYTGDLALISNDGWIVHQGRKSAFVKIAGYRVHPAELEKFITENLPVSQAVAVAYESPHTGTRLALFVTIEQSSHELSTSDLIAICRARLPRHFVPTFVQILDKLPLNHAFKIDRPQLILLAQQSAHLDKAM